MNIGNMELALSPTTAGLSVPELADLCRFAEDLGYRHSWLAEVAGPDAFVLAAAAALRTERMHFGVGVVPAYTRTPATLATAAASVSQMLGGRPFALGIGSSSETIVSSWHGLAFEQPLTRVVETVTAVRKALAGDGEYQGETVAMSRFRMASPPLGPTPVYVGALRPRMLAAAGAHGDGVCLNLMPAAVVTRQLAEVTRGAAEAGREIPESFGVMARLQVLITDDVPAARDQLRNNFIGPYLAQPVYNRFLAWMGYEEAAAAINAGWVARDREAVARAIPDRLVDDMALLGSPARVRERLEEFAAAGLTVAALMVLTPSRAAVEDTLRALAP
ncbi:MAG TPA: LLM class F420-dependent oxidoreductase [Acidimicrobiia bacterium]|nr:LLM class F420-dependent oxidoreductase [Acidimicrobiia bacterium]